MLTETQREAVKYWEIRRLVLNVLMIGAANFGWGLANSFNVGIDDLPGARVSDPGVISDFVLVFVVLNLAYSLGYIGEYLFQIEPKKKFWPRPARTILLSVIFLLLLAFASKAGSRLAYFTSIEKLRYETKNDPARDHLSSGASRGP